MSKSENETVLTIGENRGAPRLWIQGKILTRNGWIKGRRWQIRKVGQTVVMLATEEGNRKVAGNEPRPVIDCKDPLIRELFEVGSKVSVAVRENRIVIKAVTQ